MGILLWEYQSFQHLHRCSLLFTGQFFTAFLEPWINRHRISVKEVLFSLLTLLGIALIFHLDTRYRQGILLGITSSVLAALFTITNKKVAAGHDASTMLLYEMSGGFVGLSCLLPFISAIFR